DGNTILPGIIMKFAAENHLEMRYLEALYVAVDTVKADVGDVVLAAGIKAAADFDAQILHRLIELQALLTQPVAKLPRQTAGRRNSQFAGIRPWAGRDVYNSCRVRSAETDGFNGSVKLRQVRLAQPTEEDVLLHGRSYRILDEATRDVGERPQLVGAGISQGQRHRRSYISGVALLD